MDRRYVFYGVIISLIALFAYSLYHYNREDYKWLFVAVLSYYFLKKTIDILRLKVELSNYECVRYYIPFYSYFRKE